MTERVSLEIEGKRFEHWSELELTLSLDTFATCVFRAPFEPERRDFRDLFRPFSFRPITIRVDNDVLFTGTMVGVEPEQDAHSSAVSVTGYSLPGVLNDCNAPGDTVPHAWEQTTLRTIAEQLASPFGIGVKFEADVGKPFIKAKLSETESILTFLSELAQQRNCVWSSTADGRLLCWKSVSTGSPVGTFVVDGEQPVTSITATFNPQGCYSQITGFGKSKRRGVGNKHTEKNPWLTRLRPHSYRVPDADPGDVPQATRAALGRMFADMARWSLDSLPGWRDPNGKLWEPNTTLMLTAPKAMIYRRSELLIRSVTLRQDATSETASFELVLPGSFSGETPSFQPWEDPITAGVL